MIALHHLIWATLLALTVVGIPFALQHIKLLPLALLPFGRDLVRTSERYQDPRYHGSPWDHTGAVRN